MEFAFNPAQQIIFLLKPYHQKRDPTSTVTQPTYKLTHVPCKTTTLKSYTIIRRKNIVNISMPNFPCRKNVLTSIFSYYKLMRMPQFSNIQPTWLSYWVHQEASKCSKSCPCKGNYCYCLSSAFLYHAPNCITIVDNEMIYNLLM